MGHHSFSSKMILNFVDKFDNKKFIMFVYAILKYVTCVTHQCGSSNSEECVSSKTSTFANDMRLI